ncbi:MAG TPA: sigma-54 dependent transcriptional regulator [Bryobacteraceae bacterium]|jgi:DNA-binding NtrC family response regulator|nr:sigma-54 dependent transcriptional regulator [Bryobacteraceae bacterium]
MQTASSLPNISLVIVDDNPGSIELLATALEQPGLDIWTATDPEEGLDLVFQKHPQIVLTDLVMPKMTGLELLEAVVNLDPAIEVILMTAHYTTESAVEAIRKGASDYLNKPISIPALRQRIGAMIEDVRRRQRTWAIEEELRSNAQFQHIVGNSAAMWEVFSRIRRIAPHFRTVLVTGPTGSGKDLVSQALHRLSPVAGGNLVVVNCSAVVETLFESELFGHVRGAFTGATSDKIGLVEHAHQGTLFLDEIGDMPLGTQAKLLRAIQSQEVQRVGSLQARKLNFRVIAATHRDLRAMIRTGQFREDLFYRLSMVEIRTPSLAERKEDLPLLARHFIDKLSKQFDKPVRGMTQRANVALSRYDWPGNVRELENAIGHACMMVLSEVIDVTDLPEQIRADPAKAEAHSVTGVLNSPAELGSNDSLLENSERRLIADALAKASGNQSEAARRLRIGRDALRYKMRKYGLADAVSN